MSIASDLRTYADTAVAESRKVLDSTLSNAQAQFNQVAGSANDIVGKASEAVNDLRSSAEKAVNVDALKSAVEPYLDQARTYGESVQDRAEALFTDLRKDPRFAKALEVLEERVVKPVQSLTGLGVKSDSAPATPHTPSPSARKPAATKPAATKPAAGKSPAAKPAAPRKSAPRKAAAKKTPSA